MLRHSLNLAPKLFHKLVRNDIKLQRTDNYIARTSSCFHTTTINNNVTDNRLLYDQLCDIVGMDNVSKAEAVREQYGRDESHFNPVLADFVIWPLNTDHVSRISRLCYDSNVAITLFGTGTGLEGGVNALKGGVCLATNKMNQIIEVNVEDFDCTVEAGVTWRELNQYLSDTGLFFPIDPGASASLGGMSATNASGTNAVRYGTMKENVLNMEVVLPTGEVMKAAGIKARSRKSAAGFNLTELFIGSEGILGTVTQLTLRLYPIPETTYLCVCPFQDNEAAINTVVLLLQNGIPLSRIEYVDSHSIRASNQYSKGDLLVKPSLYMEIAGNQTIIDSMVELVKEIVLDNGALDFQHSNIMEERSHLWKARHDLYYACRNFDTRPNIRALITDVCVPISKLPEIILKMRQYLDKYKINGSSFGHVGDGNFHSVITYDPNDSVETGTVFMISEMIAEEAIRLGGTCTGEHGIGRGKIKFLQKEYDTVSLEVMKKIKQTIDPKNLFNPGKVLIIP
ncbi:putative D-lactate dehydrogenase, mitochondrial [Dermatophagoides farinae]|uniref:D-lactate dehydrogenase (cytochrome) n=1 Tax=Dermatophagoides farinae TaxID=6954 RepID=A0A9D4NRF1_DERFA|nr:probable D-lactate dehydrogenase, mitochondrial [Dermatophagoides farinae]KAH7637064.1 d-lactate dehydrogenase [Dermatophagoides farinae]